MSIIETDGIVLRSYSLSEADRIVVLYTRDQGLVRGVAKGARRLKSKFGSSLEPFSEIRIEYFQKEDRELVTLQHAELLHSAFAAASRPELLETLSYFADLLIDLTPPHDPNKVLYRMLRACVLVDLSTKAEHDALSLYFETWLMRLGGYLPDWTVCAGCSRTFVESESSYLVPGFRLVCGSCLQRQGSEIVSAPERRVLRQIQDEPPNEFTIHADLESVRSVRAIVSRIIASSTDMDPVQAVQRSSRANYGK